MKRRLLRKSVRGSGPMARHPSLPSRSLVGFGGAVGWVVYAARSADEAGDSVTL